MWQAASIFQVPKTTLWRHLHGTSTRSEKRANRHKLSQNEEEPIIQWTLSPLINVEQPPSLLMSKKWPIFYLPTMVKHQLLLLETNRFITSSNTIIYLNPGSPNATTINMQSVKIQRLFKSDLTAYKSSSCNMALHMKISTILMKLDMLWV